MRILEINKFNFIQGGADRHFLDLVRLLKSKGNEVAIFSMDNPKNEFSPWKKYFVSYVGYSREDKFSKKIKGIFRMFYSFEAKRKIRKLIADFKPEIVHIHNIYHQISPSILSEIKKRGIPIIMTVHDYKLICPNYLLVCNGKIWNENQTRAYVDFIKNKCFKNSLLKSLLVVLEYRFHKKTNVYDKNIDLYISPSEFTKEKLVNGGIRKEKITTLPLFFPENEMSEKFEINIGEKYVFHFGRISKNKGIDELVEIFQKIPQIKLYVAGNIEDDFKFPRSENIKYVGFLKPKELERFIKNSLFTISASKLPETFGLIALESIKNGKPFIGYDYGSFKELIENNRNGFICKNKEEMIENIKKLASDEGLRILFSRNAIESSKNFKSDQYYLKLKHIFASLIKK